MTDQMINPTDEEFAKAQETFYYALRQEVEKLVPGGQVHLGTMNNSPVFVLTSPDQGQRFFRVFLELTPEGMEPTWSEVNF